MARKVFHTRYEVELDLSSVPDLGHPELPGLLDELYGENADHDPELLLCIDVAKGKPCRSILRGKSHYMYLQVRPGGVLTAAHANHGVHQVLAGESDEHKALKERIHNDAVRAGFAADMEVRGPNGRRRTDVVVAGAVKVGWEPQMSDLTANAIRRRTKIAMEDGLRPTWLTKKATAQLINRAPWSRIKEDLHWKEVQTDPLYIVGGVNKLETFRCDNTSPIPCREKGFGRCGEWHADWVAAKNLRLSKLVEFTAADQYRVLHVERIPNRRAERFIWADRVEINRYYEITRADEASSQPEPLPTTEGPRTVIDPDPDSGCTYGQDTGIRTRSNIRDTGDPIVFAGARSAAPNSVILNWSNPDHWGKGYAEPCIYCQQPSLLRDELGRPVHKVCAEKGNDR